LLSLLGVTQMCFGVEYAEGLSMEEPSRVGKLYNATQERVGRLYNVTQ
jgi:hypothetical protein